MRVSFGDDQGGAHLGRRDVSQIYRNVLIRYVLHMDLRHLRYFVAVAEAGHITRAAAALGIQQPPLSQQIKALEGELGIVCSSRHPKGVTLTDGGRLFLAEARRILQDVAAHGSSACSAWRAGIARRVSAVGFTSSAAAHAFTPEALRACRSRFPEIELRAEREQRRRDHRGVVAGRAALRLPARAGVAARQAWRCGRCSASPSWWRCRSIIALARRAPGDAGAAQGAARRARDPRAPAGRPGPVRQPPGALRGKRRGAEVVAEVDRMMTNLNLVAAGAGISVVPASMQGAHPRAIVYRPLAGGAARCAADARLPRR